MTAWLRTAVQIVATTAVVGIVALLSDWPSYRQIALDSALIKLSVTRGADRRAECRKRTPEELAQMPANMRNPLDCQRARGSTYVELEIDGQARFSETVAASGIAGDGPARVYRRFVVPAGPHTIAVRMRDASRQQKFDYEKSDDVVLTPNQNFVIDFHSAAEGFVFR